MSGTHALRKRKLSLAVSDDGQTGYRIPETDTITVDRMPNAFRYYLFDDVESSAMNGLELEVGRILDNQEKILWWFRNKNGRKWYSIQGWRKYKIRPDFVAAKKTDDGKLELVYVMESKGEHLFGNTDSNYKKKVLDLMTEQHKEKKIERRQAVQPDLFEINEKVECYFIEEHKEAETLRALFK